MAHTPRPWAQFGMVIYSPDNGIICELSELHPSSEMIKHSRVRYDSLDWNEIIDNGTLITAAPDLLAACKALVRAEIAATDEDNYQQLVEATELARAAIIQAEGK